MKASTLFFVGIAFACGFLFGFSYHHIVDDAHEDTTAARGHAPRPEATESQWQRFEARLKALEAARAREAEAKEEAKVPTPTQATLPTPSLAKPLTKRQMTNLLHAKPKRTTSAAPGAKCKPGRKPYHLLLTAQDSPYQAWQTRIMYYHFKKLQAANPCTEMTGFTRMLNSVGAKPDGLMDEIPTVLVNALDQGSGCHDGTENTCDMGFPVMNRPHGVTQLLAQLPESITEEYVLIAETDHVFLREPRNRATPTQPACFPFGYMDAKAAALRPIVQRYVDDPDVVDPCGPSPVLIHLDQLRKLTPEWLKLSFDLKRDAEADKVFGWVLEMWGYTLAATRLGIRHTVWKEFQAEPSSQWHSDLEGDPHIYHYTFGLEYTLDGMPVIGGVGDWSLDKRHFTNEYPPAELAPPPKCAGKAAHTLHAKFNEAIAHIPQWSGAGIRHTTRGTLGWGPASSSAAGFTTLDEPTYLHSSVAQRLTTLGPWSLAGKPGLLFFRQGRLHSPWGGGTWGIAPDGAPVISLGKCGVWRLTLDDDGGGFLAEQAQSGRSVRGELAEGVDPRYDGDGDAILAATAAEGGGGKGGATVRRVLGTGPWAWTGVASVGFLRRGVLHTPWGAGRWKPHDSGDGTIVASFVGEEHIVTFGECASFTFRRVRDGDTGGGAMSQQKAAEVCAELDAPNV